MRRSTFRRLDHLSVFRSGKVVRIRPVKFHWTVRNSVPEEIQHLQRELNISPLLARLLYHRGVLDPDAASHFLNPSLQDLYDPFLMKGMEPVVDRLELAIREKQKILIYGDYDVDGITATVSLKRALEMLGASVEFYLPKRLEEGYGIRSEVLERYRSEGCDLAISVDSGIRAFEPCTRARELGMDFIVTDHHLPDEQLPDAFAILNPHQEDCRYPDKNLAAVGVVFKLIQALFERAGRSQLTPHFLKIAAIGTVADMVPLTGENRILVRFGLKGLAQPRNLGLQALLSGAGIEGEVDLVDVSFRIAPRINAVTRMGGGSEVVELFSVADPVRAHEIVDEMNQKNSQRRIEEQLILDEIEERIAESPELFERKFLVIEGPDWHRGVIGIVASRMVERFYRPVLILSVGELDTQGSGRSIPGFHLLEAMDQCRDLLTRYGGHAQAVGCSLVGEASREAQRSELADRLCAHASSKLGPKELTPSIQIDSMLPVEKLSLSLFREVQQLEPFGQGNPVPVFASEGVDVVAGPRVLKDRHLKLRVQGDRSGFDAIWWKNGQVADNINHGSQVDLAYVLTRDTYQGEEKLLLTIQDLRVCPSGAPKLPL